METKTREGSSKVPLAKVPPRALTPLRVPSLPPPTMTNKEKEKTQLAIAANDMEKSVHIDPIGQDQHGPIATGVECEQVDNVESGPTKKKEMAQGLVVAVAGKNKQVHNIGVQTRRSKILLEASGMNMIHTATRESGNSNKQQQTNEIEGGRNLKSKKDSSSKSVLLTQESHT
ncbi:hypothetical protein J5N97_004047 [Dioscorea zingiberensis]|uniref:Uncharacterized protein n=1 Tax=Dioscorea zingiberensis TaxID=325984 RepID=A0A9D5D5T2_9LILI|nr:hypothetical protein J5N97_004047 [Dioscorea zingiberensis]